jgi:hypothetical protein
MMDSSNKRTTNDMMIGNIGFYDEVYGENEKRSYTKYA